MGELSEKDFDQIERFILGKMSEEEHSLFQNEIESNPDLQKVLKEQQGLINAVETEGLKDELNSIHSELYQERPKKNLRPLFFSVAATIAVLIGFSIWYVSTTIETAAVYAEYTYTDPGLPVPMSASDSYDFYDAMVDYKTEDYSVAIEKWKKLLKSEPQNDTLIYYIGASYFNMDSLDQAQPYLEKILHSSDSDFIYKAQYMLFLSALKGENGEAVLDFEPLKDSPFQNEIEEIQESFGS